MKRVELFLITLLTLTALPSAAPARQSAAPQTPAQRAYQERLGELAEALVHAESVEEFDSLLGRNRELVTPDLVDLLIGRGMYLRDDRQDDYEEASTYFRAAGRIAEKANDGHRMSWAALHLGFLYMSQGNNEAAMNWARWALSFARQAKDEAEEAEALRLVGNIHLQRNEVPDGLASLRESLSMGERLKAQYTIAWSSDWLAGFYQRQGNNSEAARYYKRAIEAFDLLPDAASDADAGRYSLADIYYQTNNYREAVALYEKLLPAAKESGDEEQLGELLLHIYDSYTQAGDSKSFTKAHDQLLEVIDKLSAEGKHDAAIWLKTRVVLIQGDVLYGRLSNYAQALKAYRLAQGEAEKINDGSLSASALKGVGDAYLAQGNLELAGKAYEQSLTFTPQGQAGRAYLLFQIGESYGNWMRPAEAFKYYRDSLNSAGEAEEGVAAGVHFDQAELYALQGDSQQALKEWEEAKRLYDKLGQRHQSIMTLDKSGMIRVINSDFAGGVKVLKDALKQAREEPDEDEVGALCSSLAMAVRMQGDDDTAVHYFEESLRAYNEVQDRAGIVNVRVELGRTYLERGSIAEAIKVVKDDFDVAGETYDVASRIKIHLFLGDAFVRQGDYDKALVNFTSANKIAEENNIPLAASLCQMQIAGVLYLRKKYDAALAALDKASPLLTQINSRMLNGFLRILAGFIYQGLGRDEEAVKAVNDGIGAVEEARLNVAGMEQEQVMFFAQAADAYRTMVQLHVKRGDVPQALFWADRSKARTLLDVMHGGALDLSAAMSPQERETKAALEGRVAAANLQLSQGEQRRQPGVSAALYANLDTARGQLREFLNNFYLAHPELRRRSATVPPLSVEGTTALLPGPDGALLEYVVTDEEIFLFVLTREPGASGADAVPPQWRVYRVGLPSDLSETVRGFREEVAGGDVGFKRKARELYDVLLKPAQAQLSGKTSLVVVPDGVLWSVPFQALLTPANRYLLEDCAVSYAPSLATLREMRLIRDGRRASPRADDRPALLALGNPDGVVPPLPETEKEVVGLKDIYRDPRSEVLVHADATEERFKSEAGRYRVLHLATHGLLDDSNPMYSRIVLSRPDINAPEGAQAAPRDIDAQPRAPEGDGLLEAREVMDLKLNADLVVLSACESARGGISDGEGLIGLTWAFFAAGAPTTVASQWKVNSQSTTELMGSFHEALEARAAGEGGSRPGAAEALRRAALELMRQTRYRHPYFWAGFVVVGDGR